jgi:C-terminal processing protease CtpA/Prc
MKFLLLGLLIGVTSSAALAQATTPPPDDKNKPKPFAPVIASQHEGPGRIGVRLVFEKDGTCIIGGLLRGGPAADAGFRVGDVIIKIDKNTVASLSPDEARTALHGLAGTGVELTVQRGDDPHYIVRAAERRVLTGDMEEMAQPPVAEERPTNAPIVSDEGQN